MLSVAAHLDRPYGTLITFDTGGSVVGVGAGNLIKTTKRVLEYGVPAPVSCGNLR